MSLFLPREKTVVIGEEKIPYKIKELLASERNILLFRTNQMLGGSIESFINGFIANREQIAAVGGVLTGLTKTTSPEVLNEFIKNLILQCVISPKSASIDSDYDLHFCQYYDHIPFVIGAIYEHNFGSVGKALKKKLQDLGIFTKPPSETETETEQKEKPINGKPSTSPEKRTDSPLQSTNF